MTTDPPRTMFALAGGVYAIRGGKILMLERVSTFMGGFWSVPGGMQDPGETPRETAIRELLEESGLRPSGPVELVTTAHLKGYGMDILSVRFAARCEDGDVAISNEHAPLGLVRPARLPRRAPQRRRNRALARPERSRRLQRARQPLRPRRLHRVVSPPRTHCLTPPTPSTTPPRVRHSAERQSTNQQRNEGITTWRGHSTDR